MRTDYEPLQQFTMKVNCNSQEKGLIVYRNPDRVAPGPIELNTDILIIGHSTGGVLGAGQSRARQNFGI